MWSSIHPCRMSSPTSSESPIQLQLNPTPSPEAWDDSFGKLSRFDLLGSISHLNFIVQYLHDSMLGRLVSSFSFVVMLSRHRACGGILVYSLASFSVCEKRVMCSLVIRSLASSYPRIPQCASVRLGRSVDSEGVHAPITEMNWSDPRSLDQLVSSHLVASSRQPVTLDRLLTNRSNLEIFSRFIVFSFCSPK